MGSRVLFPYKSKSTFGAKNIGLSLFDGTFGAKYIGLTLFEYIFGAKNISLNCPRTLSEPDARNSFFQVFFF